jgi:hypothetical protein
MDRWPCFSFGCDLRASANVPRMERLPRVLPTDLVDDFVSAVLKAIRRAYDIDAGRYDETVGDDAVTFGIGNYRHVWFHLEEELRVLAPGRVSSSRPNGSLVIQVGSRRVRVYRGGRTELFDIHSFDFSEESSLTKASAAAGNQLVLDLIATENIPEDERLDQLVELAIVHAGNPDDGCCAVWIGAPCDPSASKGASTWAWVEQLWRIERPEGLDLDIDVVVPPAAHSEMDEPDVPLSLQDEDRQKGGEDDGTADAGA